MPGFFMPIDFHARPPVGAGHARDPSAGPTPAAGTVVTGPCRFRREDIADKVRSYKSRALAQTCRSGPRPRSVGRADAGSRHRRHRTLSLPPRDIADRVRSYESRALAQTCRSGPCPRSRRQGRRRQQGTVVTGPCRFRRGDIADKVRSYESRDLA